uniref:Carboxylesterase type B domain-containing protein n=1 Tax=Ciona savignyi TaxID=51511 RepID=H2ZBU5_CIOSA
MDFVLGRKFIPNFDKASSHTHKSAELLIRDDLAKYHPHLKNSEKIIEEYIGSTKPGIETVKAEADYLTDSWYSSKAANIGKAYTELFNGAQVYLYEFAAQPSLTRVLNPRPYDFKRADHCDDLLFFLGFPFLPHLQERGLTFTLQERELSRKLMKILATFAETGSPEISKMLSWPPFPKSVYINDTLTIRNKFRQKRMNLFEDH